MISTSLRTGWKHFVMASNLQRRLFIYLFIFIYFFMYIYLIIISIIMVIIIIIIMIILLLSLLLLFLLWCYLIVLTLPSFRVSKTPSITTNLSSSSILLFITLLTWTSLLNGIFFSVLILIFKFLMIFCPRGTFIEFRTGLLFFPVTVFHFGCKILRRC